MDKVSWFVGMGLMGLIGCSEITSTEDTKGNYPDAISGEDTEITSTDEVTQDTTLATEDISSSANELTFSVANFESSGTSLALEDPNYDKVVERNCTEPTADTASEGTKVDISRTVERSFERTLGNGTTKAIELSHSAIINRTWKKGSEGAYVVVPCNTAKTHIGLKPSEFTTDLALSVSFDRKFSHTHQATQADGTTYAKNRSSHSTGTRTIQWSDINVTDSVVTLTKTVSFEISKTFTRLNKKQESKTIQTTLTTGEEPLTVVVTRSATDHSWISRQVSGSTTATNQDGGVLSLTYDKATWESSGECEPVSGTITGELKTAAGEEAKRTFTIDLAASTKTITYEDGSSETLDLEGCAFAKSGSEKVSKVNSVGKKVQKQIERKKTKGTESTSETP